MMMVDRKTIQYSRLKKAMLDCRCKMAEKIKTKGEYPIPATMIDGQVLHKNWRINPTRNVQCPRTKQRHRILSFNLES
jgi:hypothetical protein